MTFYTYCHARESDGKVFYIGKGHGNRAFSKNGRNSWWHSVVNKHGLTTEILAEWQTEEEAFAHEKFLIACFRGMSAPLVNIANGGQGSSGFKHSEEWKEKISAMYKGVKRPSPSPEAREKIRAKLKGRKIGYSRKLSQETIKKRTASRMETVTRYEADGLSLTRREWAAKLGVTYAAIEARLRRGKDVLGRTI